MSVASPERGFLFAEPGKAGSSGLRALDFAVRPCVSSSSRFLFSSNTLLTARPVSTDPPSRRMTPLSSQGGATVAWSVFCLFSDGIRISRPIDHALAGTSDQRAPLHRLARAKQPPDLSGRETRRQTIAPGRDVDFRDVCGVRMSSNNPRVAQTSDRDPPARRLGPWRARGSACPQRTGRPARAAWSGGTARRPRPPARQGGRRPATALAEPPASA